MIQRDHDYWNEYYRQKRAEDMPSLFAQYVFDNLNEGESLVDLGCGNGRDALYFCRNRIDVTAIDQSETGIEMIQAKEPGNICCICGDITKLSSFCDDAYDHAYSRFCIHALSEEQQSDLLSEVYKVLKPDGRFWIEVRGIKDTIYGKGEQVGRNAFMYEGHYRRFIELEELIQELEENGFEIVTAEEATGFAPYRGDDPEVIRITAKKKQQGNDESN